jgi:hypothetical protein
MIIHKLSNTILRADEASNTSVERSNHCRNVVEARGKKRKRGRDL